MIDKLQSRKKKFFSIFLIERPHYTLNFKYIFSVWSLISHCIKETLYSKGNKRWNKNKEICIFTCLRCWCRVPSSFIFKYRVKNSLSTIFDFLQFYGHIFTKAVAQRCSVKKVFLKISQNSPENTCKFIKKEALTQVFSGEFCEIFKSSFFYRTPPVASFVFNILNLKSNYAAISYIFTKVETSSDL